MTQAARLFGLGSAVPPRRVEQSETVDALSRSFSLDARRRSTLERMVRGCGIDNRFITFMPDDVLDCSTAARMRLFEQHAPPLAGQAVQRALADAAMSPEQITHLITVSCTGLGAPGIDIDLIESIGLSPRVHRLNIGFMGCFGAINGLRAAIDACRASHEVNALVVAVELCSLHLRRDRALDALLGFVLFADGAAAAVLSNRDGSNKPQLPTCGSTALCPDSRDHMSWRIGDEGFMMTLSEQVPGQLADALDCVPELADIESIDHLIVHPGGPRILDAIEQSVALERPNALRWSREILRTHGNMSSPTVLFVLDRMVRARVPFHRALMLAFGPGLTIEALPVHRGVEASREPQAALSAARG